MKCKTCKKDEKDCKKDLGYSIIEMIEVEDGFMCNDCYYDQFDFAKEEETNHYSVPNTIKKIAKYPTIRKEKIDKCKKCKVELNKETGKHPVDHRGHKAYKCDKCYYWKFQEWRI